MWKNLIDRPLTTDERVSLIADLLSDPDEIEALKGLSRSDTQSFVDVLDEVPLHFRVWIIGPLTCARTLWSR